MLELNRVTYNPNVVRLKIVIVDGATATAVIGEIGSIALLLDVKG